MDANDKILSFIDLLDLDEETIDIRLKRIMCKSNFTNQHLANAFHLLQYKHLINLREEGECDNEDEYRFIAKLISGIHEENAENVCKIVKIVLELNKSAVVGHSEHLLQQILSDIALPNQMPPNNSELDTEAQSTINTFLSLKLCNSILDAVITSNEKLSLPFLDVPMENVLLSCDDKLKAYFLNNTVPRIFEGILGYNILDRIWNHVKVIGLKNTDNALKTLSCLSEFYLPVPDSKGKVKFGSRVVLDFEFWNIILYGLMSADPAERKTSMYLMKRAIDSLTATKKDVNISSEIDVIFNWSQKQTKSLKENWNNFFILMDSLEEKQSNIVLPSLKLFEAIKGVERCWLNCAFNIGLKHDNTQVRLKCIQYRLKAILQNMPDAIALLEALNDISLYDNQKDCDNLKNRISQAFKDVDTLVLILKAACRVKWSPVPFYHFTDILMTQSTDLSYFIAAKEFSGIIIDILKVPCNSIPIRHAIKINICYFVGQCYKNLHWSILLNIFHLVKWNIFTVESMDMNPFIRNIKDLLLTPDEEKEFMSVISATHTNIDFGLLYLENHEKHLDMFIHFVNEKIDNLHILANRQYSNKAECFNDVVYITHLFGKTFKNEMYKDNLALILSKTCNIISRYMFSLLQSSDFNLDIEEIAVVFKGFKYMRDVEDLEAMGFLFDIYKMLTYLLKDKNVEVKRKLFSIMFIAAITEKALLIDKAKILSLNEALQLFKDIVLKDTSNVDDIGRYRNAFYEKACEMVYMYIQHDNVEDHESISTNTDFKELFSFIENVVECGGYGCLKWILKIMNKIVGHLINDDSVNLDLSQFIGKMWKEIDELKSNNQYLPCIEEFVKLITQNAILTKPMYNNIFILYCTKIIEYGPLNNTPLYFLVRELNMKSINENFGHVIFIICEILMFSPVPKKDHRLADNVAVQILKDPKYGMDTEAMDTHFNFTIQYIIIFIMSKITDPKILETIAALIIKKIEEHLKTKQRYHGNSQSHRLLLIGLQHLLFLNSLTVSMLESEKIFTWMIELIGKLPHQPSVKTCLEWYIALFFSLQNTLLDEAVVNLMKTKNTPTTSQFLIVFWTIRHKIFLGIVKECEFSFVMDFLLSHTMGQLFNTRLYAQYLAAELYKKATDDTEKFTMCKSVDYNAEKYSYIVEVIKKTFVESSKDKNFIKLEEDYFVKEFDVVTHLTPCFIYYFLPRYFDIGCNEIVDTIFIRNILKEACNNTFAARDKTNMFYNNQCKLLDEVFAYDFNKKLEESNTLENCDTSETIQKKYIPWKNMTDVNVYDSGKRKETASELIVVATLIDKLPNLGGMARTGEVFGIKTYVVDSLRHLQDKQFQGLSVSAERWVNIEEVRPGVALKNYLVLKKNEGYTVVAAEQTSTSIALQNYTFPKKTLLLLGHEKEGIPCDLLPLMDRCVEIPQQGFVRSLNVHVTAAIFVWEYTRQNILCNK